ncbi:hypothetical protein Tco_1109904 [Tanacetum coccineum]|uniref:Transposase n=1 Tax=Tanacetum coccineum TaxID=301880 RepID=A0ABQ5IHR3_9ASTR
MDNVSDNQKVRIALIHLYEKALDWDRHFERRNGLEVTWERKFKPRTLADTYCLENLQKATNESRTKYKPVYPGYKNVASTSSVVMVVNMREKGSRISAYQKYVPSHKCSGQMFVLEVLAALDEEEEEIIEEECLAEEVNPGLQEQNPKISLNALSRITTFHTMRVKGHVNR